MKQKGADIQKVVSEYLCLKKIYHWRINSGAAVKEYIAKDGKKKKYLVPFVKNLYPGKDEGKVSPTLPDLVCLDCGKTVWIEIKKPGEKLTKGQEFFEEICREQRIEFYIIRSLEDIQKIF
jgi:hypothetical protein